MKISRIYIQGFGTIKNQWLPSGDDSDFDSGLNIVYGPNEAGKSQIRSFIEEMLFPELTQRKKIKSQIQGKVYFVHGEVTFELEALVLGNSISRILKSPINGAASMADLFPGLGTEGHTVFSNLYSFGLDQLIQNTTAGNRSLSEHLFGAVASGRGISISSVVEYLDAQLKKSIGGRSRGRTLEVIFDELTNLQREINLRVDEQSDFARRLAERDETSEHLSELEIKLKDLDDEINFIKLVQSKHQEYLGYIKAKDFLDSHANLLPIDDEIARSLARDYRRQCELKDQISEVKGDIDKFRNDCDVYQSKLTNVNPIIVEMATNKFQELLNVDHLINELDRDYAEKTQEIEQYSDSFVVKLKDQLNPENMDKSSLAREIERVGDLRTDVRNWIKNVSSLPELDCELNSDELSSKNVELSKSLETTRALLRDSTVIINTSMWSRLDIIMIALFAIVFCSALASLAMGLRGTDIFIIAAVSLILAGLFIGRATSRRYRPNAIELDETLRAAMQSLGIDLSDREYLADYITSLQTMKDEMSARIEAVGQLEQFNAEAKKYGIEDHHLTQVDILLERLSSLLGYLRLSDELHEIRMQQIKQSAKRDRLVENIRDILEPFGNTDLGQMPREIDSINFTLKQFQRMVDEDKDIQTRISGLNASIHTETLKLEAKKSECEEISVSLRELLADPEVFEDDLDDNFFETLDRFLESKREIENFTKSVVSLFKERSESAYAEFQKGEIKLANLVDELENQRTEVRTSIEELVRLRANLEVQETKFLNDNPVTELQIKYESLVLEAEETIRNLKPIALAKELLIRANKTFEEVHQPELLKLSSEIFSRITEDRYVAIVKKEEKGIDRIYARNQNGEDILDVDLSRGTREQLYIAIRLALVSRNDSLELPLLMDDVMVNSDIGRCTGLAKELQNVATRRQIVYFCSRRETVDIFNSAGVYDFKLLELQRLP